jgi:hypothetical protein
MQTKHYRIKIYRHRDNAESLVVDCPVSLSDLPKIDKFAGEDAWFDNVRERIEKQLENDLKLGGAEAILKYYKPRTPQRPVVNPIFDDCSWTIEEEPLSLN